MAEDQDPPPDYIEAQERAFDELADRLATHPAPGVELVVELSPEMAAEIDAWVAAQPDPKPTHSQAVVHFIKLGVDEEDDDPETL